MHRDAPLHTLPTLLLPIIKRQQYVLASYQNQPVFFLSWAGMNQEAEARYLTQPAINMQENDWNSGDRLWFCDWIAPFGHTREMRNLIAGIFSRSSAYGRCTTVGRSAANAS